MEHKGTRTLETKRLVLRRFVLSDADAFFRNCCYDERVTRYLSWQPHKDPDETREILSRWIGAYEDPKTYQWAIVLKDLDEVIGTISVVGMKEKAETVHIGYEIGFPWWHKGIMTEAFGRVIDYLFTEVKAGRIEAWHDTANPNSGGVMRKCGLLYEGTHRKAERDNQGIVDVCVYAILREDYLEMKKDGGL